MSRGRRAMAGRVLLWIAAGLLFLWSCGAFRFQLPPALFGAGVALAACVALAIGLLARRRLLPAWIALALAVLAAAGWWASIRPSNDRDWAPDVAHGVTGEVDGPEIVLRNVRAFDWRGEDDFTPRWETRRYNLDQLRSVDLFSSTWGNPAIAHTLIGFGFADGAHVVFSAEISRERHESFSEIGGFFKEFELVMIAADESDIIRLRTDIRRERVSRFALTLTPQDMRALFLSYVATGDHLAARPAFYQTITTNCTTVIFQLARMIEPGIPMDWRILLSGYLPDYLYEHGIIRTDLPLGEVKRQALLAPGSIPPR